MDIKSGFFPVQTIEMDDDKTILAQKHRRRRAPRATADAAGAHRVPYVLLPSYSLLLLLYFFPVKGSEWRASEKNLKIYNVQ